MSCKSLSRTHSNENIGASGLFGSCAKTLNEMKKCNAIKSRSIIVWFLLLPESRRDPFILRLRATLSVGVRSIDGVDVATKSNRVERGDDDDTDEDARTRIIRGCANRLMRLLIRLALLLLINGSLI